MAGEVKNDFDIQKVEERAAPFLFMTTFLIPQEGYWAPPFLSLMTNCLLLQEELFKINLDKPKYGLVSTV